MSQKTDGSSDKSLQNESEGTLEKDALKSEGTEQTETSESQSESTDKKQHDEPMEQSPQKACDKCHDESNESNPKESGDPKPEVTTNVMSGENSQIQKEENQKLAIIDPEKSELSSDDNLKKPNEGNSDASLQQNSEEHREKRTEVSGDLNLEETIDPNIEVPMDQNQSTLNDRTPDAPVDHNTKHLDVNRDGKINGSEDKNSNVSEGLKPDTPSEAKVPKIIETLNTPEEPNSEMSPGQTHKEKSFGPETESHEQSGEEGDLPPTKAEKDDDTKKSSTKSSGGDQADMRPHGNLSEDEAESQVNTLTDDNNTEPWEFSEDENLSPAEMTNPDQGRGEEKKDEEVFPEEEDAPPEIIDIVFIETSGESPVQELLSNCKRYKTELKIEEEVLESANKDYTLIKKKARESGCKISKNSPPSELKSVNDEEKREAPSLYKVISIVARKCPHNRRWQDAISEFIVLTTCARPEPRQSKTKRSTSLSSAFQSKKPKKEYHDNIHKLLDQEWEEDVIPRTGIEYDYRHLLTSLSVLRSEFPDAYIMDEVDIKVRGPDDVSTDGRHRPLYHFLTKIDMTKYGVDPAETWNYYGRLMLAERQLDLARRARGPDLEVNILLKRDKYNKILKELKDKTEEIEELSTRLSRFASQQLTEGNPNIADLSDTHRPTRLGEMYSQLFDDEWSEAFEAFKNKAEGDDDDNDDDDIFPDTLFILQNILTQIFQFCQAQSDRQKIELEDSLAVVIGLKQSKVVKIMITDVEKELDKKAKLELIESEKSKKDKEEVENTDQPELEGKDNGTDTKEAGDLTEQPEEVTVEKKETTDIHNREQVDIKKDRREIDAPEKATNPPEGEEGINKDVELATDERTTAKLDHDTDTVSSNPVARTESSECNNTTSETIEGTKKSDLGPLETKEGMTTENKRDNIENHDQRNAMEDSKDKKDDVHPYDKQTDQKTQNELERVAEKECNSSRNTMDKSNISEILLEILRTREEQEEDRSYRQNSAYPTMERHGREFRKALAATSAKMKSELFINDELPQLIQDNTVRMDQRIMLYVKKCLELCWYMRMQDPPMVIVTPKKGDEVDKNLFSFHGRRGKTVEVCVWPALLLHESGPLVCKGYVLPEEKKRKK